MNLIVWEDTDPDDIQLKPAKKHYVLKLMEEEAARKEEASMKNNVTSSEDDSDKRTGRRSRKESDGYSTDESDENAKRDLAKRKRKLTLEDFEDDFDEVEDHFRSRKHTDLDDIDFSDGEDDNLMTAAELRAHERKKRMIEGLEPDGRTGRPREKKRSSNNSTKSHKSKESGPQEKGHKKYKVHKYKKSATSKAARSNQKKKR